MGPFGKSHKRDHHRDFEGQVQRVHEVGGFGHPVKPENMDQDTCYSNHEKQEDERVVAVVRVFENLILLLPSANEKIDG